MTTNISRFSYSVLASHCRRKVRHNLNQPMHEEALFGGEETETRTELEDDLFGEATDSDVSDRG